MALRRLFPSLLASLAAVALTNPVMAQMAESLAPGPRIQMSVIGQTLPTYPQYIRVDAPYWRELVPARSGGRITVQLQTQSERNLSGTEIIRLVRSGQVDISTGVLSTVSGDVPLLDGADLAGLSPDVGSAKRVAAAIMPAANRDLQRFGIRLLGTYAFAAQVMWCRQPFGGPGDLRGRKVRTFGNSLVDYVRAIGAQPVSIGFPEVYSALERGTVDCAITGTGSGAAGHWPEVTRYIANQPLSWSLAGYFVNLTWWNRQEPAVQRFLEGTLAEMTDKLWDIAQEATQDGIDCNLGKAAECKMHPVAKQPMTLVPMVEADRVQLRTILEQTVLPGFVQRCGARCGELYNELVAPISGVRFGG
jgi:TRAP-type C4-dicarboxylate transport system substrate-binding protein